MHARRPALTAADMQSTGIEFDLMPLQIAGFGSPKTMPVGDQDHGGVAMPVAARLASDVSQNVARGSHREAPAAAANLCPEIDLAKILTFVRKYRGVGMEGSSDGHTPILLLAIQ